MNLIADDPSLDRLGVDQRQHEAVDDQRYRAILRGILDQIAAHGVCTRDDLRRITKEGNQ